MYFSLEMREFLDSLSIEYHFIEGDFVLEQNSLIISPISLQNPLLSHKRRDGKVGDDKKNYRRVRIYEDIWQSRGEVVRDTIRAIVGKGGRIYARECSVMGVKREIARDFLEKNHLLGYAKSKYLYGLYSKEQLVALAAFSSPRKMERKEGLLNSYEWVRYASLGPIRVVGGMGKLLAHFVREQKVEEVMSYADLDWGEGEAYRELGFMVAERSSPLLFKIELENWERLPYKMGEKGGVEEGSILLYNSGNLKFLRRFISL